jgi:hypothetical protein
MDAALAEMLSDEEWWVLSQLLDSESDVPGGVLELLAHYM